MSDEAKCAVILGVVFGYVVMSFITMWVCNVVSGYKSGSPLDSLDKATCFMWPVYLLLALVAVVWLLLVRPAVVLVRLAMDKSPRLRKLTLPFRPFEMGQWLRNAHDRRIRNRTKKGD